MFKPIGRAALKDHHQPLGARTGLNRAHRARESESSALPLCRRLQARCCEEKPDE